MKKLLITAICLFSSLAIFADDPPVREGDKCNANGENGRIQRTTSTYTSRKDNDSGAEGSANAKVKAGWFSGGVEAKSDSRHSESDYESHETTRYECVTDKATYSNWNDGHRTRTRKTN